MTQSTPALIVCVGVCVGADSAEVMRRLKAQDGWCFVMGDWLHAPDLAEALAVWLIDMSDLDRAFLAAIPPNVPLLCPEAHPQRERIAAKRKVVVFHNALEAETVLQSLKPVHSTTTNGG